MKRDRIETLKHNAKLDVRLPDQLKDEFLARCREEGVSSGAVIRSLIFDYVTAQPRFVSVMAARLKETIMRRAKWITGLAGGSLAAGFAAMSVVFAPTASAEEVVLNYFIQLTNPDGTGNSLWFGDFDTELDGPVTVLPLQRYDGKPYSVEVQARPCDTRETTPCDVVFEVALYNFDLIDDGQGGQLATRLMVTRFGSGTSFSIELDDGRVLAGHSVPTVAS